jgi:hypothetical protein
MKMYLILFLALGITLASCNKDDDPTSLNLNITGLEDLGTSAQYEGWIMVNGAPLSTGTFNVDASGNLSRTSFPIEEGMLNGATAFILTIEPNPDNDPAPSDIHILAGDFSGSSASLSIGHGAALGTTFETASGSYILATPTDGTMDDEESGVWFVDPSGPSPTLNLPTLPTGWVYEGWAVINGSPVTTGKFTSPMGADMSAPYSGPNAGPPFPGEDFLLNAPDGLTFPVDLRGGAAVISVEPYPDNSPAPFVLKPLVGMIDQAAAVHTLQNMNNNAVATNPTGTASR